MAQLIPELASDPQASRPQVGPEAEPAFVALDLETTGFDAEHDRVIEVGAVAFTPQGVLGSLEMLANPERAVPAAILELTGIDPADLAAATTPSAALERLAAFMAGREAVGHGARLDLAFLTAAGRWPAGTEILDTLDLARIFLPGAPSYSLPLLVRELKLLQPRPHRALDDADATRQLLLHLIGVVAALPAPVRAKVAALVAASDYPVARFVRRALATGVPSSALDVASNVSTAEPTRPTRPQRESQGEGEGEAAQDSPERLAELLGPDGPLARMLPDYEQRDAQVQMLLAVAQNLRRGGRLVVEAGTGTGKSLAYLIPAAARAAFRQERVVISTHTHTLQEQILGHDVPGLREWLPFSFTAALLKGRSNYISSRRWLRYLPEACASSEELCFKLKILLWLERTRTGDVSEIRLVGSEASLWSRIASEPLDCSGMNCTPETCFVHRARAAAEEADLIVVNHHLLMADAATGNNLIPEHQHLIIDEAHHLEGAATQGLRAQTDRASLLLVLDRLGEGLLGQLGRQTRLDVADRELELANDAARVARERCGSLFDAALVWAQEQVARPEGRSESSLRIQSGHRAQAGWVQLQGLAEDACTALAALDARLRRALNLAHDFVAGGDLDQALREVEIARTQLLAAAELIAQAFVTPDPDRVYWVHMPNWGPALALHSAPLEVGPLLSEHVYGHLSSVCFTSASLSVGGDFEYFLNSAGLDQQTDTLNLASPFDYLSQALMCLPTDLPEPREGAFEGVVEEVVADVARRIGGRTMVLFTSHRQLRDVYAGLKHRRDLDPVLILGQGMDGQRGHLLNSFVNAEQALLLGTSSFWEGVDVPGAALSCVVIVRLPFPVPSDPVFAARAERLRDSFRQLTLPIAALRLKQGFGRLIRRRSDRGAVVILDARLSSKDYGRSFLAALPPASRFVGPAREVGERVEAWIKARP